MEDFQAKQNAKTLIKQRFGIFNFVKKELLTTLLLTSVADASFHSRFRRRITLIIGSFFTSKN
ncbi:hypothetical protein I6G82_13695 [Lysinibacillus macroides]|uniref:Uncharacterized protein n=1 Tax=Lysinibacillus macroides TaxID=33935 RepID=A0A0N0UWY5_9BACI|nr:hypothetical protein [Lysinibacillus macroides]KOY82615.1 hypothetical protein ADM90_04560 [Lysinibacillus macroides]QPR66342.1 hypothetical protein I6G82_13695 [Lysinibacillus macroides]